MFQGVRAPGTMEARLGSSLPKNACALVCALTCALVVLVLAQTGHGRLETCGGAALQRGAGATAPGNARHAAVLFGLNHKMGETCWRAVGSSSTACPFRRVVVTLTHARHAPAHKTSLCLATPTCRHRAQHLCHSDRHASARHTDQGNVSIGGLNCAACRDWANRLLCSLSTHLQHPPQHPPPLACAPARACQCRTFVTTLILLSWRC